MSIEMKDSKIDIVKEIPVYWNTQRLKYFCDITTGDSDTQDADIDGVYPFYVRSPIIEKSSRYTFEGEGILMAGDGAGAGRIFHHADGKYAVHQRVYRLFNIQGIDSNFLFYYLSNLFPNEMDKGSAQSTVPSVRLPMLKDFAVCLPPHKEQQSIVRYLDSKCSAIDEAIKRHKKIIEKLEEYRKNNITRLATKGFGHSTTKDSGSDWYGNIPSDWEVKRFKYIAKVMSNLVDPEPYMNLPQVGPDIIEKDSGRLVGKRTVEESGIISGNHLFYEGQLLYSKVRPALNKVVTAPFTGLCSADMYPIEAEINGEYLKWLMLSKPFTEQTRIIASIRVKMPKINQDELGDVMCVVPPTEEQEKIALAIREMCDKVQTSIDKHNDVINKLDEYRKSIIYNAVTGKIDCRKED